MGVSFRQTSPHNAARCMNSCTPCPSLGWGMIPTPRETLPRTVNPSTVPFRAALPDQKTASNPPSPKASRPRSKGRLAGRRSEGHAGRCRRPVQCLRPRRESPRDYRALRGGTSSTLPAIFPAAHPPTLVDSRTTSGNRQREEGSHGDVSLLHERTDRRPAGRSAAR